MSGWSDLLATALVGTDRRGPGTDGAARDLLDAAAAWGVYRRAGVPSVTGLTGPEPAPPETRALVSPAAAGRLAILVDAEPFAGVDTTGRSALLAEWLGIVIDRGLRIPPEYLPTLIGLAHRMADLRPLVVAAGGARAGWLARQNPEWTFLTTTREEYTADDPATWHEGTLGQRCGYLAALRRSEPDRARELLMADWSALNPDERTQLLAGLEVGLGPTDEEFLERALDDRRKDVRSVAADLLARLPGSAYQARMTARTRGCLSAAGRRLVVTPPAQCDAAMRRDGIEPKPPSGLGERAWWLMQVLARTPLGSATDRAAATFLAAAVDDDWAPIVHRGLAEAAAEQRDAEWAAALLDRLAPQLAARDAPWSLVEMLIPALSPADLIRRTVATLSRPAPILGRLVVPMLEHCPAPWPDDLATAALAAFGSYSREHMPYDIYAATRVGGLRMPPRLADEAADLTERLYAADPDDRRVLVLERLVTTLQFRHTMIQELA